MNELDDNNSSSSYPSSAIPAERSDYGPFRSPPAFSNQRKSAESLDPFLGKRIRRFIHRVGGGNDVEGAEISCVDGTVVSMLIESAEKPLLYGVVHDDLDFEVLELVDVQVIFCRMFSYFSRAD